MKGILSALAGLLLLSAAAFLPGCSTRVNMKQRPLYECPDPFVPCRPGLFSQTTLDTGSAGYGYYLVIDRVKGLDTDDDEFGVAFPSGAGGGSEGLATIRRKERDEIHRTRFGTVTQGTPQKRLEPVDDFGSAGTAAWFSRVDTLLLSGKFPGRVRGDYDIIAARRSPQDELDRTLRQNISSLIYWDAQPAFAPDGRTLYFVSARPEGIGGTDIYVTTLNADGTWSRPRNLGPGVNTPCDELSPFVSGDGKWLYFSSSGHETVGGYDLFRSRLSGGQPGQVENLGMPINTPADELFPSAPAGSLPDTLLYYSSNQRGSNGFDVYVLHRLFRGRPGQGAGTERPDSVRLTGTVRYQDGTPVDGATVTLDERDPPRRVDSTTSDPAGSYTFGIREGKKYDITASKEGKLYGTEEVEVPVYNNRKDVGRDIYFLDTVVFRVNFPFNDASNPYEFTLDDQGLPSDRRWADVIAQAADVLRRIDPASGTRIELVGHTDPVGSYSYNLDLGRRRAEFIRQELTKRGVNPALLAIRSAGEGLPLPARPDEPEELYHARLRRVELFRK